MNVRSGAWHPLPPVILILLVRAAVSPALGQEAERPSPGPFRSQESSAEARDSSRETPQTTPPGTQRSWWTFWSRHSGHDRLFLGMWTFHPFGDDPYPQGANNGLGLQYRGLFAFTCVNSFERRTWALGVERVWAEGRRGPAVFMLGYRVGLIRGYDTRLFQIAGETPVLPFAGTVALFRLGPLGGEVSWVYKAVSLVGAVFY